jgi:hypothetical protein
MAALPFAISLKEVYAIMNTNGPRVALSLTLAIIVLTLACGPCGLGASEDELPGGPVEISAAAADNLETKLKAALQDNPSDSFVLHLTDEEVTSYAATRWTVEGGSPIADPQLRFSQGKVFVAATLTGVCPFRVRVVSVASAQIVNDRLQMNIEQVQLGPLPMPESFLNPVSHSLNETLADAQLDITVTDIQILEGEIIIVGKK